MVIFNLLSGHKGLRRKTTRTSLVGVREFYSASEACGQRCLIQRERDRAREEGEKVEDREREKVCVCMYACVELEVGTQARNGGGGLGSGWEREAWWWEKDGAFYGCAVRSRRRHDERA